MSEVNTIEISWSEFSGMIVEQNYFNRKSLKTQNRKHKHLSGTQWVCWTPTDGEFLPECKGKLHYGKNV